MKKRRAIKTAVVLAALGAMGVAAWWFVSNALLHAEAAHCRANIIFIAQSMCQYKERHGALPYVEGDSQSDLLRLLEREAGLDPWFRREAEEGWERGYPIFTMAHRPPEDWRRLEGYGAGELDFQMVGQWPLVWCHIHPDWPEVLIRSTREYPMRCPAARLEKINACAEAICRARTTVPDLASAGFFEWGFQQRADRPIRSGLENLKKAKRNSVGMLMVPIPGGRFQMGMTEAQVELIRSWATPHVPEERWTACRPRHEVEVGPFRASSTLVSEDTWNTFLAATGRKTTDHGGPLRCSWSLAMGFCRWLTNQERAAGRIGSDVAYRLPTEAEWEWMILAGGPGPYPWGEAFPLDNAWGIYPYSLINTFGIVAWTYECELCLDWYDTAFYGGSPRPNPLCDSPPAGPGQPEHVMRGGQLGTRWTSSGQPPLSTQRSSIEETVRISNVAFRLVLSSVHIGQSAAAPAGQ